MKSARAVVAVYNYCNPTAFEQHDRILALAISCLVPGNKTANHR